eukprot:GHUV01029091.1.p2 GENE.GHUV01029091.1~~GHUV01029091.1.p2  ORF type:complete len:100 (-),score=2.43 GHUV01029091.1:710-1009(-)
MWQRIRTDLTHGHQRMLGKPRHACSCRALAFLVQSSPDICCIAVLAGRISPEQWPEDVSHVTVASTAAGPADDRIVDFKDGDDPTIRSHWALLVAGSAG